MPDDPTPPSASPPATALRPTTRLIIDPRYAGPPGSGNGGYVCGRLAAFLPETPVVEVTLRQPPPLQTPLDVTASGGGVALTFGGALLAEAAPGALTGEVVDPVDADTAAAAMGRYAGLVLHPFPGCFACGVDRPAPDGLGLRPGRLTDRPDSVATVWRPDASLASPDSTSGGASDARRTVRPEMVWAALDCPGGWSADLVGRPMLLGRMAAAVDALPQAGEQYVVVGRALAVEGRKTFTASTMYDGDGRVVGRAEATWIAMRTDRA
ncbi:MAG: hypothetical protein QOE40_515 [Actinomycetota bacterium]|nr:hypothetical protein [Actinomycetota bacterium]